jgi:hypothetical protein
MELKGIKGYSTEFAGQVKVKKNINIDQFGNFFTYDKVDGFYQQIVERIAPGTIIPFTGKIQYEMTDNGWRAKPPMVQLGRPGPSF